jgi:hypothetical protein
VRTALLVLSLQASSAFADKDSGYANRLALLPIVNEGAHGKASLSSIFSDVSKAIGKRLGLTLISSEEMFAVSQEGVGESVLECGPDVRCIASRLRSFNARMGLVLVLDFGLSPPVIRVQLVDTDDQKLLADSVGELPADVSRGVEAKVDEVLEKAGYVLAGRIVVKVDPPNAIIRLKAPALIEPDKGTPNVFTVAPGSYEVLAEAEGYEPGSVPAEVTGGSSADVSVSLSEATSIIESPWLWIGVGVGAAAAITTGVLLGTRRVERCLCLTIGDMPCSCDD